MTKDKQIDIFGNTVSIKVKPKIDKQKRNWENRFQLPPTLFFAGVRCSVPLDIINSLASSFVIGLVSLRFNIALQIPRRLRICAH